MRVEDAGKPWPDWLCRALSGLDAAVFAAIPLFAWFSLLGVLRDRYWWAGFNLCAWPFLGDRVFDMGLSSATVIGASFLLFIYGTLGVLMGLWFRPESAWGAMARALILGLAWHFIADRWFWNWVSPYSASYFSARMTLPGHLLWGLFLLRYQSRYEAIARAFGDPALWPEPEPEIVQRDEPAEEEAIPPESPTAEDTPAPERMESVGSGPDGGGAERPEASKDGPAKVDET